MQTNSTPLEVLDQIHTAILIADFAALERLTPALETSMERAAALQNTQLFAQIKSKSERNAACLMAAGRGVRAAQRRLAEMRDAATGFSTYDGRGNRANHGQATNFARRY
jgi:hypothetical protein